MTHQPAISFSNSFLSPFNPPDGRTSNVRSMNTNHEQSNRREKAKKIDYRDTDEFLYPDGRVGSLAIFRFKKQALRTDIAQWSIPRTLDPSVIGRAVPVASKHPDVFDRLYEFKSTDRINVSPLEEAAIGLVWEFRHVESLSCQLMYDLRSWQPTVRSTSNFSRTVSGVSLAYGLVGSVVNIVEANRTNELPNEILEGYPEAPAHLAKAIRLVSHYFRFRPYLESFLENHTRAKQKPKKTPKPQ